MVACSHSSLQWEFTQTGFCCFCCCCFPWVLKKVGSGPGSSAIFHVLATYEEKVFCNLARLFLQVWREICLLVDCFLSWKEAYFLIVLKYLFHIHTVFASESKSNTMTLFPDNSQAQKLGWATPNGIPMKIWFAITRGKHNETFHIERQDLYSLFTLILCPGE